MTVEDNRRQSGTFVSPWAILSIVAGTFIFCPVATIAGPLFGLKAFSEMRNDPRVTGRGMAKWGIIFGCIFSVGWLSLAVWWHFVARKPMLEGPKVALTAGFSGDIAGFRAGFCCESDNATNDDAARFLSALSQRYGEFLSCYQNTEAPAPEQPIGEGLRKRIPYGLVFDRATLNAEAEFVVFDRSRTGPIMRFAWLRVFDDKNGDITYPPFLENQDKVPASRDELAEPSAGESSKDPESGVSGDSGEAGNSRGSGAGSE